MKKVLTVLLLMISFFPFTAVHAEETENTDFINDEADVLTTEEENNLSALIQDIYEDYEMPIYIHLYNDLHDYFDIETLAEDVYTEENMGIGSENDGILLLMEFHNRSYDICVKGHKANAAYGEEERSELEENMLPYFREDSWYMGLVSFITTAGEDAEYVYKNNITGYEEEYISRYEPAKIYEVFTDNILLISVSSLLISGCVIFFLISRNRTRGIAADAHAYVDKDSVNFTRTADIYTHTTRTVTHIPRDNDHGGSGGGGGGGFSHSSGHF